MSNSGGAPGSPGGSLPVLQIALAIEAGQISAELDRCGIGADVRVRVIVELLDHGTLPMAAIAQAGKTFDWLADEPDVYPASVKVRIDIENTLRRVAQQHGVSDGPPALEPTLHRLAAVDGLPGGADFAGTLRILNVATHARMLQPIRRPQMWRRARTSPTCSGASWRVHERRKSAEQHHGLRGMRNDRAHKSLFGNSAAAIFGRRLG